MLTETDLDALLAGFKQEAFRFELRDRYNSVVGAEPYRRWAAGEPDDYAWNRSWMEKITADVAAGKAWRRVRIVSVPVSDYTRYGIAVARLSIQAGEDIRYLDRATAKGLGLAPYDDGNPHLGLHLTGTGGACAPVEEVERLHGPLTLHYRPGVAASEVG
ncbi:DUF6879 family protein [Streptosporangium sp. NPDC006007]|uniref:DUF6879 family protein n=1 Tax=Streptosporangium sp. NPDC006007 TaxID=3154575 RepID=UPI0033B5AEDE